MCKLCACPLRITVEASISPPLFTTWPRPFVTDNGQDEKNVAGANGIAAASTAQNSVMEQWRNDNNGQRLHGPAHRTPIRPFAKEDEMAKELK